jgi:WD40 repeat protein
MDVGSVAVSKDGGLVAVGGYEDGRALVYDVAGRRALPHLPNIAFPDVPPGVRVVPPLPQPAAVVGTRCSGAVEGTRRTAAVAFDAGGSLLVGSPTGTVRVVDPRSGRVVRELRGAPESTSNLTLEPSDDGRSLLTAGSSGLVRWDVRRGRPSWTVSTGPDACGLLAVHGEAGVVLCGRLSGAVDAFDLETGRSLGPRYDLQRGPLSALLVASDGRTLVQASAVEPVTARWRLDGTGPITTRIRLPGAAGPFSPDGRHLLVDDDYDWTLELADPTPAVVSAGTGEVVARLDGYQAATWAPSAPGAVVAWGGHRRGDVVDIPTGRLTGSISTGIGAPPHGFAAAADSPRTLLWGFSDRAVYAVVDLASGDQLWTVGGLGLGGGALTPDGRTAVRLERGRVLSTDVDTGMLLSEGEALQAVAISPAGVMLGANAGGLLQRYDPRTLEPMGDPLDVTRGEVAELVFDGSGDLLALRRPNGTVTLVDVATGTELGQPVPGQVSRAGGAHISLRRDGELLSVPVEGGAAMWALSPKTWVEAACRLAGRELTPAERERHVEGQGDRTCRSAVSS